MLGSATRDMASVDQIGAMQQAIARSVAAAQVAERRGDLATAIRLRRQAAELRTSLQQLMARDMSRPWKREPPAPLPGPRSSVVGGPARGLRDPRPSWVGPSRSPGKAPGPNPQVPRIEGVRRLPGRRAGAVLPGGLPESGAVFTPAQQRRLQTLERQIARWLRRHAWALRRAPRLAPVALRTVRRLQAERAYILRHKGKMNAWQLPLLRSFARRGWTRPPGRMVGGRSSARSARSAAPLAPLAPPMMVHDATFRRRIALANLQRRQAGLPPLREDEIDRVRGEVREPSFTSMAPLMPAPDVPLPGTGPTPTLRTDPRRAYDPAPYSARTSTSSVPDDMDEPTEEGITSPDGSKQDEGSVAAPEGEGFLSRYGMWLALGALALAGAGVAAHNAAKRGKGKGGSKAGDGRSPETGRRGGESGFLGAAA